nr:MAG TPA: hypothetical protein [Caudoviricetes sp.]
MRYNRGVQSQLHTLKTSSWDDCSLGPSFL